MITRDGNTIRTIICALLTGICLPVAMSELPQAVTVVAAAIGGAAMFDFLILMRNEWRLLKMHPSRSQPPTITTQESDFTSTETVAMNDSASPQTPLTAMQAAAVKGNLNNVEEADPELAKKIRNWQKRHKNTCD